MAERPLDPDPAVATPRRTSARLLRAVATSCALVGCGGSSTPPRAPVPSDAPDTATPVSRYLGLADGILLAYETHDDASGEPGLLVGKVHRLSARLFSLEVGSSHRVIELRADGALRQDTGTYLLAWPLKAGATWSGERGATVRVTDLDKSIDVPAGHFVGCVETLEGGEGPGSKRTTTVYCPDVGITVLEVAAGVDGRTVNARAVLRSRGPAVDLGARPE
jgi:hypothetical protein